jgi:type I restriction enzyme S subunit
VPVPPLGVQHSIASLLSSLDEKIELNRRANETLETIARAIFKDWFVDFGPIRAKMEGRVPYLSPEIWSLFPDLLDNEGGPEGWEESNIGREVDVVGGSTPSTKVPRYWGGECCWATPKDLSSLKAPVLLGTERQITKAGLSQIGSGLLPTGTVLLSSRAPIGYLAVSMVPTAVNQGFIAMVCRSRLSNVFAWLWTNANMDAILQNANGSTFQEISKANFRPIPVIVPPDRLLAAFDKVVRPMFDRIAGNEQESQTLATTRDLLLPKLMSGEIRVNDTEMIAEAAQ